jgi:hypothetical protein
MLILFTLLPNVIRAHRRHHHHHHHRHPTLQAFVMMPSASPSDVSRRLCIHVWIAATEEGIDIISPLVLQVTAHPIIIYHHHLLENTKIRVDTSRKSPITRTFVPPNHHHRITNIASMVLQKNQEARGDV